MATEVVNFSDPDWVELGTGLTSCLAQASGTGVELHLGDTVPQPEAAGYALPAGIPIEVPLIMVMGGGVWARGKGGKGALKYNVA